MSFSFLIFVVIESLIVFGSGGLGLTGGLVDVGNLFDCLNGIHQGLADDSILDRYNEVRREKYLNIIDPVSSQNLRHLLQDPDVALKEDPLFQNMDMLKDPEAVAKLVTVSRASYRGRKHGELMKATRASMISCTTSPKSTSSRTGLRLKQARHSRQPRSTWY